MEKKEPKENPRQAVVMLIYNEGNEVLFTRRAPNRKYLSSVWALPSGHIEEGETYQEAVIREAKEELNIDVSGSKLNQIIQEPSGDNTRVYLAEVHANNYQGAPSIISDEFKQLVWMPLKDFYNKFTDEEIGSTLRHIRPQFQR